MSTEKSVSGLVTPEENIITQLAGYVRGGRSIQMTTLVGVLQLLEQWSTEIISLNQQLSAKTISEQNIINAFGIKGEGAHSKLVIEYVHGLVAERDAVAKLVNAMADIGDLIKSQDNRCTDQPFFAVLTKRELPAAEDYDYDRIIFVHPDRDYEEADDRTYRRLEALDEGGRDLRGWQRLAVKKVEEFRVGCFTEQGCKDYISRNGHNLNEPFIYAYGSYRNNEFQEVRNFLIEAANLRAGRNG